MAMKNVVRWMALAAVALVSTSAFAAWNPDTDTDLLFNMNFEIYDNGAHTTTDAEASRVGTVYDYNTTSPDVFGETSRAGLGVDANFAAMHDNAPGGAIVDDADQHTDCKVTVSTSTSVFNLGYAEGGAGDVNHTWAFWFNVPNLNQGTIIRHASIYIEYAGYDDLMWEIRILGGKMHFYHKNNTLRMETGPTLAELGVDVNTWHSAAIIIDRTNSEETSVPTTQLSTKIYIDGLEVPVIVTSLDLTDTMNVVTTTPPNDNEPIWFGAGEREFDGLLDDIRFYDRDLNALEVSILNQPDTTKPRALLPIPRSENVVITSNLTWDPADGASSQILYFGTDAGNLPQVTSGGGSLEMYDPPGSLSLNTEYFWYVRNNGVDGPLWSFTTETGKALNPSPADQASDINLIGVDLSWNTPTAATYAVYLSQDSSLVESSNVSVRIADNNANPFKNDVDTSSRGATYYWRVNSTYSTGTVNGDIWSFRTKPYEIVFNTSSAATTYADHTLAALSCDIHGDGWTGVATGSLASDGVAVFEFPDGFDYNDCYDIIVVPALRATDVGDPCIPTPIAIHATGDFYFDGRAQLAGDDILTTGQDITFARSGGFPGPKHNQDTSVFNDDTNPDLIPFYWNRPNMPVGNHSRYGTLGTAKFIFIPTDLGKSVWGPGQPVNPPYKGGGGGGAGGVGGEAGRGYFFGIDSRGPSYGDKEVPVPFGGSSGGWGGSNSPGGAAGGGGIEIVATGSVTLDSNSMIIANGGGQRCSPVTYPAGGGGGGSVRIIATGSVTNKGSINVNGGRGGNGSVQGNNTGGGGGGGRVAVFYGTTYSDDGVITAEGGAKGTAAGTGLSTDGEDGTIFTSNGSPSKASAPTPVNGDKMAYCNPDPCTSFQLKWYSGYDGSTDAVYCGTNPNPGGDPCGTVSATRGQHSMTITVSSGNTYYWKVVTDDTVSSDVWSFKTTSWQCPFAISDATPHVGGPEWDFNHDCVLDIEDLGFFVNDWLSPEFGAPGTTYFLDFSEFAGAENAAGFANEWMQCINRTDGGCAGF